MDLQPDQSATPAKRGRFEIKAIFLIVAAVIVVGAIWVALNGSPTRNRAAIDSSANPTSTLSAAPKKVSSHPSRERQPWIALKASDP